jgi:hypothetical protein
MIKGSPRNQDLQGTNLFKTPDSITWGNLLFLLLLLL